MKAVLIIYNQSLSGMVQEILNKMAIRGYTQWTDVKGRGSLQGETREGTHTWPELNNAHLTVVEEKSVAPLLKRLKALNKQAEAEGLRAFVWHVEDGI